MEHPDRNTAGLLGHLVVGVAEEPALAGFGGGDDGVVSVAVVGGGVAVGRGVAAADVSAGEAGAEVNPTAARLDALFAHVGGRGMELAVAEVFAEGHS